MKKVIIILALAMGIVTANAQENVTVVTDNGSEQPTLTKEVYPQKEADDFGAAGRVLPVMNIGKIADAIVELAQNPGLREQMGEIGYRRVRSRYRIQDMRKTYEEIYRKMEGEASWQE